jgi:hypothetical protein
MDKKRNYYLIVPIENVYQHTKENGKLKLDNAVIKNAFKKYNVPEDYQKLIFKISFGGKTEPNDAIELITEKLFCFKKPDFKTNPKVSPHPVIELLSKDICVVTLNKITPTERIKSFYQMIIDNGIATDYCNALRTAFGLEEKTFSKEGFTKIKEMF